MPVFLNARSTFSVQLDFRKIQGLTNNWHDTTVQHVVRLVRWWMFMTTRKIEFKLIYRIICLINKLTFLSAATENAVELVFGPMHTQFSHFCLNRDVLYWHVLLLSQTLGRNLSEQRINITLFFFNWRKLSLLLT
jgi:hypothetical protein